MHCHWHRLGSYRQHLGFTRTGEESTPKSCQEEIKTLVKCYLVGKQTHPLREETSSKRVPPIHTLWSWAVKKNDVISARVIWVFFVQQNSVQAFTLRLFYKNICYFRFPPDSSLHGLTFLWWGCYGFCLRHKLSKLAHFFKKSVLVSVFVSMALSTVFHSINSPDISSLSHCCSSGLISALLVLSTKYSFMKVSFNSGIILCS